MKYLILLFVYVSLLACSSKKEFDSPPAARVNDVFLTEKQMQESFAGDIVGKGDVGRYVHEWVEEQLLYQAALHERLNLDGDLLEKRDSYYRKILGYAYLDLVSSREISIQKNQIKKYYNTNKESFKRKYDEALVYHFTVDDKKSALKIKKILLGSNSGKKRKDLLLRYSVEPTIIKKGFLIKDMERNIFSKKAKSVIGPISINESYHVVQIIKKHKKGSLLGLDRVYDEIYSRLLQKEKSIILSSVLDSLRNASTIYINKELY